MNSPGPIHSGQEPVPDDTGAMTPQPASAATPGDARPLVPLCSGFVFGLVCALAYERTRSLAVVVAAHALTNLLISRTELLLMG